MAQVEDHRPPSSAVLAGDRAGHLVAGGQLVGEALPRGVAQVRPFSAHRLGDEEPRRARERQRRRMELDELHIEEGRPRSERHGHSVAGGHGGVGRLGEHAARAPGGEERRPGEHGRFRPRLVEETAAGDTSILHEEIGRASEGAHRDGLGPMRLVEQRAHHLPAGRVAERVQDPGAGVRAFAGEVIAPVLAVEASAPRRQLADALGPLFDEHPRRGTRDDAGARAHRVVQMQLRVVVFAQGHRHPALGVAGVALAGLVLRHHEHGAVAGEAHRRPQAGDPRAEDEEVGAEGVDHREVAPFKARNLTKEALESPRLELASKTRRVVYRDSRIVVISQRSPRPSES